MIQETSILGLNQQGRVRGRHLTVQVHGLADISTHGDLWMLASWPTTGFPIPLQSWSLTPSDRARLRFMCGSHIGKREREKKKKGIHLGSCIQLQIPFSLSLTKKKYIWFHSPLSIILNTFYEPQKWACKFLCSFISGRMGMNASWFGYQKNSGLIKWIGEQPSSSGFFFFWKDFCKNGAESSLNVR